MVTTRSIPASSSFVTADGSSRYCVAEGSSLDSWRRTSSAVTRPVEVMTATRSGSRGFRSTASRNTWK